MSECVPSKRHRGGCAKCVDRGKSTFHLDIRMAFQPIVDTSSGRTFAHEALVRGPQGEGAGVVLAQVTEDTRYALDQKCRVVAIETAARLGLAERLSINFMPNAVYNPAHCIQTTLWTAEKCDFPPERIIFEFTESEEVDHAHLQAILAVYHAHGFQTAIDDFGAGHSGLRRLSDLHPDLVKLDMGLIRGIDTDRRRRAIVAGTVGICRELGIEVVAEGIETVGELHCLQDCGIDLIQGYLLAHPALDAIACPNLMALSPRAA
jgi:EAL domain-containing protein (putative c-di-GMP-specific phosphodiesterase class I)